MIGLLFFATVIVWLLGCIGLSQIIGNMVTQPALRAIFKLLIFFALLLSPFVDEVIGKRQFEALCKANGIESVNVSKARGRNVKVKYGEERRLLEGTIVPIKESDVIFRDAGSGEVLIQHKNYYASGGWLMRYTWLSMGSNHTMLFDGNGCDQRPEIDIFQRNSITFLYK